MSRLNIARPDFDPIGDFANRVENGISNPFDDVVRDTFFSASAMHDRIRLEGPLSPGFALHDISIDFDDDIRDRRAPYVRHPETAYPSAIAERTSSELMMTLNRHMSGINIGRHNDYVTREELHNYLVRVGDRINPQDRRDLEIIMGSFRRIADADGRKAGKGISYQDMNAYMEKNAINDQYIQTYRELREIRAENARLRELLEGRFDAAPHRSDGAGDRRDGRVITERRMDKNGHYFVDGADLPLSQEDFKRHYGIPMEIDLLKFMPGKPNDGQVTDYWTSGASVGLGGRTEDGRLKWEQPDYHTLKYDFSRNFAQVFKYLQALPPEMQEEFAFNFARTQTAVFRANGYSLKVVENEKVFAQGAEHTGWTDFVQDIGSSEPRIQW